MNRFIPLVKMLLTKKCQKLLCGCKWVYTMMLYEQISINGLVVTGVSVNGLTPLTEMLLTKKSAKNCYVVVNGYIQ